MVTTMNDIMHPGATPAHDPEFPYAPPGWSTEDARKVAKDLGLELSDDHWETIRVLQGCYTDEEAPRVRLLCDALKARFKSSGGFERAYELFPEGPIKQGCKIAGLEPPTGIVDTAQGSSQ